MSSGRVNSLCLVVSSICILTNIYFYSTSSATAESVDEAPIISLREDNAEILDQLSLLKRTLHSQELQSTHLSNSLQSIIDKAAAKETDYKQQLIEELADLTRNLQKMGVEKIPTNLDSYAMLSMLGTDENSFVLPFKVDSAADLNGECLNLTNYKAENRRRLQNINGRCKAKPFTVVPKLSKSVETFYFNKSKLSWCPIFKSASSNVFAHFCLDYFNASSCYDKSVNGAGMYRADRAFADPVPLPENTKRFSVVRDPFNRLLSVYRDKFEFYRVPVYEKQASDMMMHHRFVQWTEKTRILRLKESLNKASAMHNQSIGIGKTKQASRHATHPAIRMSDVNNPYDHPPYPTFSEFIAEVLSGAYNNHWIPASQLCGPCGEKKFDYVVKMENFECEFNRMLEASGNKKLVANYEENWAKNSGPPTDREQFYRYYATLTSQQLDQLLELYKMDCEFYEYDCWHVVTKIKRVKIANPSYQHKYADTW